MQPTNPNQVRGSFTKPEQLKKSIAEHELKRDAPPQPKQELKQEQEQEPAPQEATQEQEPARMSEEEQRQIGIDGFKKLCEKEYKLTLTDDDLKNYLFRGILSKELRINKLMSGTFQSLRTDELQEIDKRMAEIKSSDKYTPQGLINEEAVITLSYSWTHVDGKPLGNKPEDREKTIRKMGSLFVSNAADARINYETLIKIMLNDEGSIKK